MIHIPVSVFHWEVAAEAGSSIERRSRMSSMRMTRTLHLMIHMVRCPKILCLSRYLNPRNTYGLLKPVVIYNHILLWSQRRIKSGCKCLCQTLRMTNYLALTTTTIPLRSTPIRW
jgi:hypothetical protein